MIDAYPTTPGHRGVDTSVAAAEAVARIAGPLRRIVFMAVHEAGGRGLTIDELAAVTKLPRYSVQPRTTELKHDRRIRDSGRRRPNASGCNAIVWVVASATEGAA